MFKSEILAIPLVTVRLSLANEVEIVLAILHCSRDPAGDNLWKLHRVKYLEVFRVDNRYDQRRSRAKLSSNVSGPSILMSQSE